MNKLSIKQKMLFECIEWYINENGIPPTIKELATLLKCGTRPVFEKIMVLEQQGYIKTTPGKARSIRIIKKVEND